jgi:2-desacetyl-2-hydroxyethyl bacteriochlorophyllide A dehydrogenase
LNPHVTGAGSGEMLALVVSGPAQHALERVPRPAPGPDEALVAVSHVAMCGTDLRLLRGGLHDAHYPVIPGHEWAGLVLAAESRPGLVGAAVVADGMSPCRRCDMCAAGAYNLCVALDEVGFTRPGAFAELVCVPAANLRALPEGLSGSEGCLLEPLCVALHAVERAPDLAGRAVGVIGAGTVGLLVAQLGRAAGAKSVVLAEPAGHRQTIAAGLGLAAVAGVADWAPDLPEVVFDATGAAAVFPAGLEATRPGGAYVLVGYSGADPVALEPAVVMLRELTVYGVLSGYRQLDRAVDKVLSGEVRLGPLVSAPRPLSDYRSVLDDQAGPPPLRHFFTTAPA